jgi:HSP20 family molecular chaperone IbpA
MPGVDTGGIDIRFENGILSIHGKVENRQAEGTRYLWTEYAIGDYHRTFEVSEVIDPTRITAEYADGQLTLHLPKVEAARPRQIEVNTK